MCVFFGTPLDLRTFDEGGMTITDGAAFNGRCPGTTISISASTSKDSLTTEMSASSGSSMSNSMPTMTSMQFSSLSSISSSVSSNGCGVVTGGYTVTYSEIAPQITGNVRPDLEKVLFYKVGWNYLRRT